MIFILCLVFLSLVLFHVHLHYGRTGRLVNKLPGPKTVFILGNILDLNVSLAELYRVLRNWSKRYYPSAYRLWLGNLPIINISHPDDLGVILRSSKLIQKGFAYVMTEPWLKNGLLLTSGEKWHCRRKILNPAFYTNILNTYFNVVNQHGEKSISQLTSQADEIIQELPSFCSKLALDIICESTMGVSLKETDKSDDEYEKSVHELTRLILYRFSRAYICDWMLPFFPKLNKEIKESVSNHNGFINKIIEERRKYHEKTNYYLLDNLEKEEDVSPDNGQKKNLATLDLLLAAEKNGLLDDAGVIEEVATFVFAGHDTTGVSMMYTIMLLAENKHAQDQARAEVQEILDAKHGKLEMSDLQNMKYLERCIKESLRLFPSVPLISRYLTEDLQFKNFLAPKGSEVSIHILDTHRNPNFWPDPEKFDPDRFLPENFKSRHPYCYVPFSAGLRNCIGQKFAMMEMKSLIARILYNFDLEPVDFIKDIEFVSHVVLRTNHPVRTKFIRRKIEK